MQTVHDVRFVPVARVRGIDLGLDARWLDVRGWGIVALVGLAAMLAPQADQATGWLWMRLCAAVSLVGAVVLTSLGHELGHVLASRMVGLPVRAVVLAPQGGVTIRSGSDAPLIDFLTALAGPAANAILGVLCVWLTLSLEVAAPVGTFIMELAALQLLTALVNLLPYGAMDGQRMLAAVRAL